MIEKILKHMRVKSGLKQSELADRICLKQNTISEYETGIRSPNFDVVEQIAAECDYEIAFIDKHSGERLILDDLNQV